MRSFIHQRLQSVCQLGLRRGIPMILLSAAALAVSGTALAGGHRHGGPRVSVSFAFGYPVYSAWYPRPYPVYRAYYPVVVAAPQPTVYVEQPQYQPIEPVPVPAPAQPQAQAPAANDWFYCSDSRAYYPYVRECPGGWQRVPAQPPR